MTNRLSTALAAAQLIGIVIFGVLTVTRFPIWSPVDEGAHFSYLQTVAEQRRLPILKKDLVSPEVRSILQGRYPLEAEPLPAVLTLGDYSYEAFQPPLYYLAAVPAFSLSDDYRTKVVLVRFFDLALLLVGIGLFALLCRSVFPEGPMPPFAIGLSAFLIPGALVRAITVSNSALEIPLVVLLMLLLWRSHTRPGTRHLAAAALVLGLCLLTRLTLAYLVPIYLLALAEKLLKERQPAVALRCAACLVIPVVMMLPWFVFNLSHYDSLTAQDLAKQMQLGLVNPDRLDYGVRDLDNLTLKLLAPTMPEEWAADIHRPWLQLVGDFIKVALFMLPLGLIAFGMRKLRDYRYLFLGAPFVANLIFLTGITLSQDFDILKERYLYSSVPLWFLFCFALYRRVTGSSLMNDVVTTTTGAGLLAMWVSLGAKYYY